MPTVTWFNPIFVPLEWKDEGIVPSLPPIGPTITLYSGDEYCGMEVCENTVSAQDVKRLQAKKFVELIMQGKTPTKAAKELNEQLSRFQTRKEVQLAIVETLDKWEVPAEIRKRYSRAKLVEILANQDISDPRGAKVALEAVKIMGQDDEVGYLNPKASVVPQVAQLPDGLMKLLGGAEKEEDVIEGEEDEDDKAA